MLNSQVKTHLDNIAKCETYIDRMKYCDKNFHFLGSGYNRDTYAIDDNVVIKISKFVDGINQNKTEYELYHKFPKNYALSKVFKRSKDYTAIVSERCTPVKVNSEIETYLDGYMLDDLYHCILIFTVENFKKPINTNKFEKFKNKCKLYLDYKNNKVSKKVKLFLQSLEHLSRYNEGYTLDLLKKSAYGFDKKGKLKLIDFGWKLRPTNKNAKFTKQQLRLVYNYLR